MGAPMVDWMWKSDLGGVGIACPGAVSLPPGPLMPACPGTCQPVLARDRPGAGGRAGTCRAGGHGNLPWLLPTRSREIIARAVTAGRQR